MQNFQVSHEHRKVNPSAVHGMNPWNRSTTQVLTRNELSLEELNEACRSNKPTNNGDDFVDYIFEVKTID